ncbi:chromo' (CHRromatin Organization MOdifier) domain protein [Ostertagia ostertagi]
MKRELSKNPNVKTTYANESYVVEKILSTRRKGGHREYLIKWEGYPYEEATWEDERDCDCPEAIAEFHRNKPSRARGGKDDSTVMIGEQTSSAKQSKGARRATLSETKGIEVAKKSRRRTASTNLTESASKRTKVVSEESKGSDRSAIQNGVRSLRSGKSDDSRTTPQRRRSLKDRIKSEQPERDSTDRVYKLQQGKEIEDILGVNKDGSRLLYAVQYKGTEPKHQRIELVPSSVLRSHAIEELVDFLEQLVVANTTLDV